MLTISVIVPTYRRPKDLERCLEALKAQEKQADEVLVIMRDTDLETQRFIENFDRGKLPLKTFTVSIPGVVAAMNRGLESALSDVVAFTDDDAAPHPNWLQLMEKHFLSDERVGAVGGKDLLQGNRHQEAYKDKIVGKVQWFGRIIGNHSYAAGEAREVDVLKGVNMSFRRLPLHEIKFDDRMKGTGAQVYFEDACCLTLKRKGWKIIYDPQIVVDHYVAQRFDEDQRLQFVRIATVNKVHNETLNLLEYFSPFRRVIFLAWVVLIGTRNKRGIIQCLRFLPTEGMLSVKKTLAALEGRWLGWQTWRKGNAVVYFSAESREPTA